jgi:hypothetical protein
MMVAILVTMPALAQAAQQAPPPAPPSFSARAIAKAVTPSKSETPRNNLVAPAPAKTTPKQATSSGSFFKTRTGVVVLAVMAVGTGFAVYSAKEDRIRGSVR